VLALTIERGRATGPVHDGTDVRPGDIVAFVVGTDTGGHALARLAEGGWTRLELESREAPAPTTVGRT
jgi:hypothetical protein